MNCKVIFCIISLERFVHVRRVLIQLETDDERVLFSLDLFMAQNQRNPPMMARANNQVFQDNYDYELRKIMEQERQSHAGQVRDSTRLCFLLRGSIFAHF